jgi:hypothetical protein
LEELTVEKRKKEEDLPGTIAPIEELKARVVAKMGLRTCTGFSNGLY